MVATGIYDGKRIIFRDEAEGNRLHNKGRYGLPLRGGKLRLSMVEALYLLETDRVQINRKGSPISFKDLFKMATRSRPGLEVTYPVYRDLRDRGYIIQSPLTQPRWGGSDLWIYERGVKVSSSLPGTRIFALSERAKFDIEKVIDLIESTEKQHMRVVMALVDEEGDLTYYEARLGIPRGRFEEGPIEKVEGTLIGDRVLVTGEGAADLHRAGFYGKLTGTTLHLSLLETAHLMKRSAMALKNAATGRPISVSGLVKRARKLQPEFETRLRAYEDMRERGLVVKTGFKYGTHFRVYEKDPDQCHARYLMHAVPVRYTTGWPEVCRAVRLAHGVRKDLFFVKSPYRKGQAQYLQLKRIRP